MSNSLYHGSTVKAMSAKSSDADKAEFRIVYPDVARQWIDSCVWDRQRPVRPSRVSFYAKLMKRGEWIPNSPIRFCRLNGRLYLVNGRHRLMGLIESQTAQRFLVIEHTVSSDSEIASIYAAEDRNLGRTPHDQLHAIGIDDMYGWNKTQLNTITASVKFIACDFMRDNKYEFSIAEIQSLLDKYARSYDAFWELTADIPNYIRKSVQRRATISVALVTLSQSSIKYGMPKIKDFWRGTLTDEGLVTGDPRKLAHRHLISSGMEGAGASSAKGRIMSAAESARYLAHCFNAWSEDRAITFTRVMDETAPIRINGSLYDGKRESVETLMAA